MEGIWLLADVADEDVAESVEVAEDELEVELDFEGLRRVSNSPWPDWNSNEVFDDISMRAGIERVVPSSKVKLVVSWCVSSGVENAPS